LVPNGVDVSRFRRDASANARSVEETPAEVPLANAPPANAEKHVRRKWEIAPDSFLLLTVARLDPRKGHRLVIDALQHLPDCTYLIAGTGTEKAQLQRRARQCGVSERVVFAGLVPDTALPRVYQACDLFVMPSEHVESTHNVEGFGISFLEANAAGKAVVGTRTGGIPTAIRHEQTGLLCEPSVASVREAIRRMKDHPAFRRQCEQRAAEWAEAHQWSRIVPQIDAVIETALHEQERS
jgi:phosphatidylinositol alpha-1,6-mannosyltransferase